MKTLILGGARSGKSALAERLAAESGLEVTYLATATTTFGDGEMAARIAAHRARRPPHWALVEAPLALAPSLRQHARPERLILLDCLTLWLSNLLLHPDSTRFAHERADLLDTLPRLPGQLILVGNEVGHGIVPLGEINRRFVDESGRLHQALAAQCERVAFVMAGLAQWLKG